MVHAIEPGLEGQRGYGDDRGEPGRFDSESNRSIAAAGSTGFWDAYELIPCLDGKARRIEPGTFPLATGVQVRMGLLRGYGNAIVPQVAAEFVKAYIEVTGGRLG
jgi:DNA (cytosine-5)-methyltransferase 1